MLESHIYREKEIINQKENFTMEDYKGLPAYRGWACSYEGGDYAANYFDDSVGIHSLGYCRSYEDLKRKIDAYIAEGWMNKRLTLEDCSKVEAKYNRYW